MARNFRASHQIGQSQLMAFFWTNYWPPVNTGILFLVMCIYAILAVDFFMNYGVDAGPMKASKETKKIVGARVWRIEGPFEMPTKVWHQLNSPPMMIKIASKNTVSHWNCPEFGLMCCCNLPTTIMSNVSQFPLQRFCNSSPYRCFVETRNMPSVQYRTNDHQLESTTKLTTKL